MSVYEVHLGSWRQGLSYRELADELVEYVSWLGFTHVELLPVAEHPFGGSWGYQVTGYYAPTSRFGSPDEFRYLVDQLHQAGIGVIVDWVPAHFPKDEWALARFDGTPLYEHADPRRGEQLDWGTLRLRLRPARGAQLPRRQRAATGSRSSTSTALRVDAVASMLYLDYSRKEGEWMPNQYGGRENLEAVEFLQEMNATVYRRCPGVMTIAEESTAWPGVSRPTHLGGLGFGFKWNMGWMHDSLDYMAREPVYRGYHHHQMTFSMVYAYSENYVLPISHDEVVHGKGSLLRKMPGDRWQQLANLRAYLAFMWAHPGKQLLFMGQEFAQESEWSEERSLDWWLLDLPDHRGVALTVQSLNAVYKATPALWSQDVDPPASPGSTPTTRRQRLLVPALRQRRLGAGLHQQLRRHAARGLPPRPAVGRHLARGAQHRRAGVLRQRRRQRRLGRGDRRRLARPARQRAAAGAAARHGVARQRAPGLTVARTGRRVGLPHDEEADPC